MDRAAFRTPVGDVVTAVTADEMRTVDRVAVESFGLDLLQMMENAGRTLANVVRSSLDSATATGVTVVAGNGGNGGGGICCARHLANRDVPVRLVLDRLPDDLDGAAAEQHAIVDRMGVPVETGVEAIESGDATLVVDGLVGYGLQGPLRGTAAAMVEATEARDAPVVSLDVPSGLDATTGERPGVAVSPDRVVTLALPKTGLSALSVPVTLADISVPAGVYHELDIPYQRPFADEYVVALSHGGTD